jgi:KipI family sensor histidine kinase inhibitor
MSLQVLSCGEHAVLVELDGLEEVLTLNDAVRAAVEASDAAFAGVVDIVPAARTLLVVVGDRTNLTTVRQALPALAAATARLTPAIPGPAGHRDADLPGLPARPGNLSRLAEQHVVEIRVHYDGPDLSEISELIGLTPAEVVVAHTQSPWRVAFAGFSPGFAYLSGGDSRLQVPRRCEPRTSVPAGSVGLAGEFSAIYPRSSPGGWQLLGHIDEIIWDVDRQPPALLQPGSTVQFVDVGAGGNAASG